MPFIRKYDLAEDDSFTLTNGRSAFSASLAEYALMTILHFNKQVPRLMMNKEMKNWDNFTIDVAVNKRVAFVGFGHIAQETAKLLQRSFNMKISILKRSRGNQNGIDIPFFEGIDIDKVFYYSNEDDGFNKVYDEADYVICTLPGTEETLNFVGAKQFKRMKKDAVFISLGRGIAVDEEALAQALETGEIRGAAVDVFKTEPLPKDSALWTAPNLCKKSLDLCGLPLLYKIVLSIVTA